MKFESLKFIKMAPEDTFRFQCSRCGECCHNVKGAIFLTSLDLFRIARYRGQEVETIFEFFTDLCMVDEWIQFPFLVLRAKQKDDACWMYRTGRCSIQEVKPLVCRLYPMNVGPDEKGGLEYHLVSEKQHHYTGAEHRAGEWMAEFLTPDDRRFMLRWYSLAKELGRLISDIIMAPGVMVTQEDMRIHIIKRMYLCYDISSEFWPQFDRNTELLKREMKDIAKGKPLISG